MSSTVTVKCPNCGRTNRIASRPEGVPRCGVCHHALPWVVDADQQAYDEELRSTLPVLVDFWAPWCGPCRMVTPAVERLATEMAGRLKVVKLNVDEAPAIAGRYAVQGIPLLVLHRDGQEIDRRVGALPEAALRQWLAQHVAPAGAGAGAPT
jgi:thioredoxin 2